MELNRGYTGVWASAAGERSHDYFALDGAGRGHDHDGATSTTSGGFTATASGATFHGRSGWQLANGSDGDAQAESRGAGLESASYFAALQGYGIDAAASFSMELENGDPSRSAGIAQVGPAGDPILLPTPSLQTNFSPTSLAFWKEVYAEMAGIQAAAGLTPYLAVRRSAVVVFSKRRTGH